MDDGPHVTGMGPDSIQYAVDAAHWAGEDIDDQQRRQLVRFRDWLESEAIPGGGVGPNETGRLWSRHIADAILFTIALEGGTRTCADLGSGAGLPGIPLAILRRDVDYAFVDKSERRCELLSRAIAVLRLDNCEVVHSEFGAVDRKWDAIVSRAAMPVDQLVFHVKRLLAGGGSAVVGLSRLGGKVGDVPQMPAGLSAETIEVPADVLDTGVQLLRIVAI